MKYNTKVSTFILTIIGSLFLLINLKKEYFDEVWDYFFVIIIFMSNANEYIKLLKERKDEKNR